MKTDQQWRKFMRGYFLDTNPWASEDESKREWIEFAWEIAACAAIVGFVIWLSYWPHGR